MSSPSGRVMGKAKGSSMIVSPLNLTVIFSVDKKKEISLVFMFWGRRTATGRRKRKERGGRWGKGRVSERGNNYRY